MSVVLNEKEWCRFMENTRQFELEEKKQAWRSIKRGEKDIKILNSYTEAICLDTETTGTGHKDQIIQFSAIRIELPSYKELDRIDVYIRPDRPVRDIITEITGITNEFLALEKPEGEVFPVIKEFLGESPLIIAYNTRFDKARLEDLFKRQGEEFLPGDEIDVMEMAKDLISPEKLIIKDGSKYDDGKPHYKQEFVAPLMGADEGLSFHSAIDDTIAVLRLLRIFTKRYEELSNNATVRVKEKVDIKSSYYWENPYKKTMMRFRVITNIGEVYLDCWTKQWCEPKNKESKGLLSFIDMEDLQAKVFRMWHVSSIEELIKVSKASRKMWEKRTRQETSA